MSPITAPSFDLSHFDLRALGDLDDKVVAVARDAAYIAIGFGVLTFQQAQVRRREIERAVTSGIENGRSQISGLIRTVSGRSE